MDGPVLETERLILRLPVRADLEGMAEMMADEDVARFIGGVMSRPVAWRTLSYMAGSWALLGFGMFSVIEKATGRWIGRIGPLHPEGWPGTEVGWGLVRDAWGKGYAYEASVASMDFAVDRLGWTDIVHTIAPENTPSAALAQRLGSTNRGPTRLPDPYADVRIDLWGQTADQWRARRRR
jgi:RimJ/RimL family protein N-acetyltransferase